MFTVYSNKMSHNVKMSIIIFFQISLSKASTSLRHHQQLSINPLARFPPYMSLKNTFGHDQGSKCRRHQLVFGSSTLGNKQRHCRSHSHILCKHSHSRHQHNFLEKNIGIFTVWHSFGIFTVWYFLFFHNRNSTPPPTSATAFQSRRWHSFTISLVPHLVPSFCGTHTQTAFPLAGVNSSRLPQQSVTTFASLPFWHTTHTQHSLPAPLSSTESGKWYRVIQAILGNWGLKKFLKTQKYDEIRSMLDISNNPRIPIFEKFEKKILKTPIFPGLP